MQTENPAQPKPRWAVSPTSSGANQAKLGWWSGGLPFCYSKNFPLMSMGYLWFAKT